MRQGVEEEGALSGVQDISTLKPLEHWGGLLRHIDLTKVVGAISTPVTSLARESAPAITTSFGATAFIAA